jgi:hypothetical protein
MDITARAKANNKEIFMESQQSRRRFLQDCAKYGGACCTLLAWNRHLTAGVVLAVIMEIC